MGVGPSRGFSVIDLMNFVALTGLLAALGMYGASRYLRSAKTAEAISEVKAIAEGATAYYERSDATQPSGSTREASRAMRHFPPSSTSSVPPDLDLIRGKRYQSERLDWAGSPWAELGFSVRQPQHYAYSFQSSGTGSEAKAGASAQGDLDGDGKPSLYRLDITVDDGFRATISPQMVKEDPEE